MGYIPCWWPTPNSVHVHYCDLMFIIKHLPAMISGINTYADHQPPDPSPTSPNPNYQAFGNSHFGLHHLHIHMFGAYTIHQRTWYLHSLGGEPPQVCCIHHHDGFSTATFFSPLWLIKSHTYMYIYIYICSEQNHIQLSAQLGVDRSIGQSSN